MVDEEEVKKIPMPPLPQKAELYLPIAFWSEVMIHLDRKIQTISTQYGFGKVEMVIKIHKEKIMEVSFNDEIRIRGLVEKAGSRGNAGSPQSSTSFNESDPT